MADITLDDLTAGRGYEHWATQSQMESLINQTKDIPRIAGFFQSLGSTSKKETDLSKAILDAARKNLAENKKQNQGQGDLSKGLSKNQDAATKAAQITGANISKLTQATSTLMRSEGRAGDAFGFMARGIEMVSNGLSGLGKAAENATTATEGGGQATSRFGNRIGRLTQRLGSLDGILQGLAGVAGFSAASLKIMGTVVNDVTRLQERLSDRGFSLTDDFVEISTQAMSLGIGFNELEKVVERGRRNFAALSGSVGQGTRAFLDLYSGAREQLYQFGNFGLPPADTMEAYQEFLDSQITTGKSFAQINGNADALNDTFMDLMKQTAAVARLTGTRREELLQQRFAAVNDNTVQARLRFLRMTGRGAEADRILEAQGAMATGLGSLANSQVGQAIMNAITQFGPTITQTGSAGGMFVATGQGQMERNLNMIDPMIVTRVKQLAEQIFAPGSNATSEDITRLTAEITSLFRGPTATANLGNLATIPGPIRKEITDLLAEITTVAERGRNFTTENLQTELDRLQTSSGLLQNTIAETNIGYGRMNIAMQEFTGRLQGAFLLNSINTLQNLFGGENSNIREFADSLRSADMQGLATSIGTLTGAITGMGANLGINAVQLGAELASTLAPAIGGGATINDLKAEMAQAVAATNAMAENMVAATGTTNNILADMYRGRAHWNLRVIGND